MGRFAVRIPVLALGVGLCIPGAVPIRAAQVHLSWAPTTESTDGEPLPQPISYQVCYGQNSGSYDQILDAGTSTNATLTSLDPNTTYYFAVRACTTNGSESSLSEEVSWCNDADADSLPDSWEQTYLVSDGGEDEDGDGTSNLAEFVAGTNPTNAFSAAGVAVRRNGTDTLVEFDAVAAQGPGYSGTIRYYTLESTDDLTSGVWTPVPGCVDVVGTGDLVSHSVTLSNSPAFFRTRIRLEDS